jgi:hypothetical protein
MGNKKKELKENQLVREVLTREKSAKVKQGIDLCSSLRS